MHTRGAEHTVQHKLGGNPTWQANRERHGGVTRRVAVCLQRRRERVLHLSSLALMQRAREGRAYLLPILPLDDKLVLQHHEVTLALIVGHERLQPRAERIEQVPRARGGLLGGEEPNPAQTGYNPRCLGLARERARRLDLLNERTVGVLSAREIERDNGRWSSPLRCVRSANCALRNLRPG